MVEFTAKDRAADAAYELATSPSDGLAGARDELNKIWSSGNLPASDIGKALEDNNLLAPLALYDSANLDMDNNGSFSIDELVTAANADTSDTLTKTLAENLISEVSTRDYEDLSVAELRSISAGAAPKDPIPGEMNFDPATIADGQIAARDLAFANEHFSSLDRDSDGYVLSDEIQSYLTANNDSITPEDAAILGDLSSQVPNLEENSNDEWGDESAGFTRNDLQEAAVKMAEDLNQERAQAATTTEVAGTEDTAADASETVAETATEGSPATAETVLNGQEAEREASSDALTRLSSADSSTEDQLAAIKTLVEGGQTTATLRDADGNALNIRMEVVPISEGSDRSYVQMFAVDENGRETVVLRAVSDGNGFSQQRDADGNLVSYVGSRWSSRHPESVFGE